MPVKGTSKPRPSETSFLADVLILRARAREEDHADDMPTLLERSSG